MEIIMKKRLWAMALLCALLLSGCGEAKSIGIIGGADGPTSIYVKGQFGEQYEKRPIRMMNIDGELYYDSGLISDMTPRCGTLDGGLKKAAKEDEVPQKPGEANFDAEGYQSATGITKEVPIDGEWVIFKKFDGVRVSGDGELKYCYYIKGHLNSAAIDSELAVLTDNRDISFSEVFEPLLSAKADAGKGNGTIAFDTIVSGDKWGLTLTADDITPKGLTIKFEQFGGAPTGELQTGDWYTLETTVDDEWQPVEPLRSDYAWHTVAYGLRERDITEFQVDWEWLYGELPPGFYRLSKKVHDFRGTGDFDEEIYEVTFTVE